jgi:DNA-binding transcriptional LysR family regulator
MAQRYPHVTFEVTADESGVIYRALEARKLDLAIARVLEPVPTHLKSEILYDDRHVVAAGGRSSWSRRRRIQLADLMNEPWVLPPPNTLTGSIVAEAFRAAGLEVPAAKIVTSSTPARIALVASGRFLSILPVTTLPLASKRPSRATLHRLRARRRQVVRELAARLLLLWSRAAGLAGSIPRQLNPQ